MDLQSGNYIPVEVDSIVDNSVTDFNLYLSLDSKSSVLYSSTGYLWVRDELQRLLTEGFKELFTEKANSKKLKMYREINHLSLPSQSLAPSERIKRIEQIGTSFTKCLYEGEITEACIHKAKEITTALTECIQEQRQCVAALDQLIDHNEYVFHHSVRVAMYATAIALEMGLQNPDHLKEVAFGGIVHDLGKSKVPETIINKNGPLSEDEWKIMKSHPEIGHSLFENTRTTFIAKEIILHHHEKIDGSGYPHGISKDRILPEVQIVILADVFDALTSVRSYQKARSKFEALELIKEKMIGAHINYDIFRAFISCLAIPKSLKLA